VHFHPLFQRKEFFLSGSRRLCQISSKSVKIATVRERAHTKVCRHRTPDTRHPTSDTANNFVCIALDRQLYHCVRYERFLSATLLLLT